MAIHFDDREDEILGLVQPDQNLVLRYSDCRGACRAALHLDKSQSALPWNSRLNVVAAILLAHVQRLEAEPLFCCDYRLHRELLHALGLTPLWLGNRRRLAFESPQ